MKERIRWYLLLLRDILLMPLVVLMPRNRRKIVFGAWGGKQFGCNPKYLFEYVLERGGFKCVWIGDKALREDVLKVPGAIFATKGSFAAFWHCMTAGFQASNVQWRSDIINLPNCRRAVMLYLTHGFPDKKSGDAQYGDTGPLRQEDSKVGKFRQCLRKLQNRLYAFLYWQEAWFSASSEQCETLRVNTFPARLAHERALRCGIPRADFLIHNAGNVDLKRRLKEKYAAVIGAPVDKKWYVFVPTWRHEKKYLYSFASSPRRKDFERLLESQGAVLIEKHHPKTLADMPMGGESSTGIFCVTPEQALKIDTQELLVACDRLITDYSSVYYDFVLMNRPVIHYIYDYDHFMNLDMGFLFDIKDYGGGPFAETEDELLKCLAEADEELLSQRNPATKEKQLTYETGHACEGYYALLEKLAAERGFFV